MEWTLRGYMQPGDPKYHPEIDESEFLVGDEVSKYRMMVGSLNWLVTLGRYDIHYVTNSLARYLMCPREGHMMAMKRVFGYLKHYSKFGIKFDVSEPDLDAYSVVQYDWFAQYGKCQEELPDDMPTPKGKAVRTSGFFDSDHAGCLQTRRSTASNLLFINNTPVRWYSKRQQTVESSAYGSEMVAGRIAVEHAVELRYILRMLGVPVKGATLLFGDNESMVKNVTLPQSTLKKRHNAIAYHKVRQAVAAGFVGIVHCRSEHNLADWGTKAVTGKVHQHLMHHQTFPPTSVREYRQEMTSANTTYRIGHSAGRWQVPRDPSGSGFGSSEKESSEMSHLRIPRNSQVDEDVVAAFLDTNFVSTLVRCTQSATNPPDG